MFTKVVSILATGHLVLISLCSAMASWEGRVSESEALRLLPMGIVGVILGVVALGAILKRCEEDASSPSSAK